MMGNKQKHEKLSERALEYKTDCTKQEESYKI